jgi:hypothetical protein
MIWKWASKKVIDTRVTPFVPSGIPIQRKRGIPILPEYLLPEIFIEINRPFLFTQSKGG